MTEIFKHISFAILVSVVTLSVLILAMASPASFASIPWIREIFSVVVYFLVGTFLCTLLLILKRVHVLFKKELGETKSPASAPKVAQ